MIEKEIIEGNDLICKFLGFESNKVLVYKVPNLFPSKEDSGWTEFDVQDIGFERDWNMLMPVVEKISKITIKDELVRLEIVSSGYVKIANLHDFPIFANVSIEGSLIKAVYKAVVKFITWHNNQSILKQDKL